MSAAADDATPVEQYEIVEGENDEVEVHEQWVYNLAPETTYSFRVASRSADGQIAFSPRRELTTYAAGEIPEESYGEAYYPDGLAPEEHGTTPEEVRAAIKQEASAWDEEDGGQYAAQNGVGGLDP
jgi:hypothetical protein